MISNCIKCRKERRGKYLLQALLLMFAILVNVGFVSSMYDEAQEQKIVDCIENVQEVIDSFREMGFNTVRLVDLKLMIEKSYESNFSYDSIMKKCDDVNRVNFMAYSSRDYIDALKQFYSEADDGSVNMSSVDLMIEEIDLEFENERYEKIEGLVDETYDEIIEIQSSNSALIVFYESTSNSVVSFFEDYWKEVLVSVGVLLLFYFIFRRKIKIAICRKKIRRLEDRKSIIKDLIGKTQNEYFGKGRISEGMYFVRVKKFSDIIRDLDKEILGLDEKLLKMQARNK